MMFSCASIKTPLKVACSTPPCRPLFHFPRFIRLSHPKIRLTSDICELLGPVLLFETLREACDDDEAPAASKCEREQLHGLELRSRDQLPSRNSEFSTPLSF